jgi:Gram-negative bacterial TonB protein C-terminal
LASSVNLRSGLLAVGALRSEEGAAQGPVALETTVIATGARPGDTAAKRELFTEETQTVLVFEQGAVIRLSAAVADGQLLFLTNKATGKEVVTQVLRKRSFRPTNCYVDLEFTEACPDFWGIEFPKAGKAASVSDADAAEKLSDDEDSGSGALKPAVPPSMQEVERLKSEVAGLQTQLKSLQTGQNPVTETAGKPEVKSAAQISAELVRKEEEKRLEELFAMEAKQDESNLPKRLVAYPQKSANRILQQPGVRRSLIAALVVVLAAAGAYWFGALRALTKKTSSAKAAPSQAIFPVSGPTPVPIGQKTAVGSATASPSDNDNVKASSAPAENIVKNPVGNSASIAAADNKTGVLGLPLNSAIPGPVKSSSENVFSARVAPSSEAKRRRGQPASELTNKRLSNKPAPSESSAGAVSSTTAASDASGVGIIPDGDGYIGPKLVRGVKPVAPAEALKNYVTGNVNLDALVDAAGHVKSVTVLSGPAKLRETAIEDIKQYIYQPAKKNGKAVPAHVQVSLQFWYEP